MTKDISVKKILIHPFKRRIAKYYLFFLRRLFGLKVIGITGSAGKTTTKEMLASILNLQGETKKSYANIDPVYNIPTTILKCSPKTRYLVLEMGVEFPKEMDFYLWLARPDIGVITNIYPTHTEFFKNIEGVLNEKKKLVEGILSSGTAILNSEDKKLKGLKEKLSAKTMWYGKGTEVQALGIKIVGFNTVFSSKLGGSEKIKITLPVLGPQYVSNALAAASAAKMLGVGSKDIKRGLENFKVPEHRMKIKRLKSEAILMDDSYNSNPEAAKEAIKAMSLISGNRKKAIVFGDMLELGEWEEKYHKELGEFIGNEDVTKLICVGPAARATSNAAEKILGRGKVFWVLTWRAALEELRPFLGKDYVILVKGSRGIELDKLVAKLR